MKKFVVIWVTALAITSTGLTQATYAAKKTDNAPSADLRKKAWKQGLIDCRKRWGSSLHEVHVEKFYGKWTVVCYHY